MIHYYRYASHSTEAVQFRNQRKIKTTNPRGSGTWYTTTSYDNPAQAESELALPNVPTYRIGPVPDNMIPGFDIPARTVAPRNGHPGGGTEVRTQGEVILLGCWDFSHGWYV